MKIVETHWGRKGSRIPETIFSFGHFTFSNWSKRLGKIKREKDRERKIDRY